MAAQFPSYFMGTDPVHGAEGAIEMSNFENPPTNGPDNKYTDLNPHPAGWHDQPAISVFRTNKDDVPNSPKGQGGSASTRSVLEPPIG